MAFRFEQLTLKSQEAVQKAQALAQERGHPRLEAMHLLVALLQPEQQVVRSLLDAAWRESGPDPESRRRGTERLPQDLRRRALDQPGAQPGLRCRAGRSRSDEGPVRLGRAPAAGAVQGQVACADRSSARLGIGEKEVLQALQKVRGGQRVTDQTPEDKYQALERYGRDLVALAKNGKMDPVIGRDSEIRQGDAGAQPANQEQPVLDRRARRRQDGDRRGAGAADRFGRRSRELAEPPADRA